MFNSLRARIFLALGLVIFLAIVMSLIVAAWSVNREFDELVVDIGFEQAREFASVAEVEYNLTGNVASIPAVLSSQHALFELDAAFVVSADPVFGEYVETPFIAPHDIETWELLVEQNPASDEQAVWMIMQHELSGLGDSAELPLLLDRYYWAQSYVFDPISFTDSDSFHIFADESIIYFTDADFTIQFSSDGSKLDTHLSQDLQPYSVPIGNWQTNEIIGYVFVESSPDFVDEGSGFIEGTLYTSVIGGLLTAIFALMIGAWLARRISDPVHALTIAATKLAENGSTEQLPIRSNDELGQMSAAFNRMTRSLAAQQNIRQQLIADVSHELNTPLSIMRLEAQGMADGMQTPEEAAINIQREIDLLRNLVNDLELVAEADQDAIVLQPELVDMLAFLEEVVARWQPKAMAEGIELRLAVEGSVSAEIDPARMRQVLGNLLRNALQHTNVGGQVVVAVRESAELQLSIRDNGEGISAEHLPHIFERFYRADEARQRISGGRGLGLAIVKQLVELHGGRIWATSEVGVGSTFFIALPTVTTTNNA